MHSLTSLLQTEVKRAIQMFGEYSFNDKGPGEVMELDEWIERLNQLDVEECARILVELSKGSSFDSQLVEALLCEMQDIPDERWNALMKFPELEAAF